MFEFHETCEFTERRRVFITGMNKTCSQDVFNRGSYMGAPLVADIEDITGFLMFY